MYSSKIVDATDPDIFVASVRPAGLDYTVTERGPFRARSLLVNLERVWAQRCNERLARVKHADVPRGGVMFMAAPGPSMYLDGAEIGMNQITVADVGCSYTSRLLGPTRWAAVTLTKEDMEALCPPEADVCNKRVSGITVFTPPPEMLARLRSLHNYMGHLVKTTPRLLENRILAYDLEYNIMAAMQDILTARASDPSTGTASRRHHRRIVRQFCEQMETQPDKPLPMPAISQIIGVSSRTLRLACQEQLGISPCQYVVLRRMRSVRRALQGADPGLTRVTDIATDHGFFELGRFAVKYRQVFGEAPSATLRRNRPTPLVKGFEHYASGTGRRVYSEPSRALAS